jgi:hypothetical protein
MATEREKLFDNQPLERVADEMAGCEPSSRVDQWAKAEFLLRQTKAQIAAAQAAEETARYAQRYTRYMFWSVVFLALSVLGTFILEIVKLCQK